jgi:hypothetical protein
MNLIPKNEISIDFTSGLQILQCTIKEPEELRGHFWHYAHLHTDNCAKIHPRATGSCFSYNWGSLSVKKTCFNTDHVWNIEKQSVHITRLYHVWFSHPISRLLCRLRSYQTSVLWNMEKMKSQQYLNNYTSHTIPNIKRADSRARRLAL